MKTIEIGDFTEIDPDKILMLSERHKHLKINMNGFFQNLNLFPSLEECQRIFTDNTIETPTFTDNDLVINIRCGELTSGQVSWYPILPVGFYKEIIRQTDMNPIFMGQLDNQIYLDEIRKEFPNATYIPSQGVMQDFQIIRSAKNICISVSTFSWLAAWLSDARNIFYPLAGFLSPALQRCYSEVTLNFDLAPDHDSRYRFYSMPLFYNDEINTLIKTHKSINTAVREVPASFVKTMKKAPFIKKHDTKLYYDFSDKVDYKWYVSAYPAAAAEIADGWYDSPQHHYETIGWKRQYSPFERTSVPHDLREYTGLLQVSQSSVDPTWARQKDLKRDAELVINGSILRQNYNHTQIQHAPWWSARLAQEQRIRGVLITNRFENEGVASRLFPCEIQVSADGHQYRTIRYLTAADQCKKDIFIDTTSCQSFHYFRILLPGEKRILHLSQVRFFI